MASEDFQGNDSPGTGAEDGRGLIAQVLYQAPDIVGVSLEPMIVVLRAKELAVGKATSIVDHNGVVCRQMFCHPSEAVGCARGHRDHEHNGARGVDVTCG